MKLEAEKRTRKATAIAFAAAVFISLQLLTAWLRLAPRTAQVPPHLEATLARCRSLHTPAGPPPHFHSRKTSDRFDPGTRPTLLTNARIWTGVRNGTEEVRGDVLIAGGVIKKLGYIPPAALREAQTLHGILEVVDAKGRWVTPGIVDMHSHVGVDSLPSLEGSSDYNSAKGPILPWLRSLDGLNTHDASYKLSIAGGVTSALVLPGSGNAIGGQGFTIKLRLTKERSTTAMLLEPPYTISGTEVEYDGPPRWRQMKHACGENPSGFYAQTRMDTAYAFRAAYSTALALKKKQDAFCERALSGDYAHIARGETFPEDLKWEALVDVLRGRVRVQAHCYEAVDLDALVRLSNEFKFPLAAVHHASEAFLVPDVLKRAYGGAPGVALFALQGRYKREAYRASEFAPAILSQHGLRVAMKSDHPVMDSRRLLYEAQQAHYYGLPANLALSAVTATPAELVGLDYRVGYIKEGWDADLVIWDSHPLALGATPTQVFIDGIAQLDAPHTQEKPHAFQHAPETPDFSEEAKEAVRFEGLPPLGAGEGIKGEVRFVNVRSVYTRGESGIQQHATTAESTDTLHTVVVTNGSIACVGACSAAADSHTIDLRGGGLMPAMTSFGAPLGLEAIQNEPSTNDGAVFDPFTKPAPALLGGADALVRAADGLQFETRDALLSYRAGVTTAITPPLPSGSGFLSGIGTHFSTGAPHRLAPGAVREAETGLHVAVRRQFGGAPSVSAQIAALRRLLLAGPGDVEGDVGRAFWRCAQGEATLVVEAHSADIIASLLLLKKEVEARTDRALKMTLTDATEAHLLAKEIGEARVGVIVRPRPFPTVWEDRRVLPGPPLSERTAIVELMAHNVTVGLSNDYGEIWSTRNTRLDVAWAAIEAGSALSKEEALALGSTNVEELLGAHSSRPQADLVATTGGDLLQIASKVTAVLNPRSGVVHVF